MILFWTCLTLYLYNGPLKPTHTTIADENCADYWWSALLYVNNLFGGFTKSVSELFLHFQYTVYMISFLWSTQKIAKYDSR